MNKVILCGRLTKDPEARHTSTSNTEVSDFTIAVDRFAKAGEEKQADFLNCKAFGKTAEFINKYFKKGRRILIEGRIQNRSWEDAEGKKRYVTEIIVDQAEFADSKPADTGAAAGGEYGGFDDSETMPF